MTWLVFGLGAILALGGSAAIASGLPYIQVEFGWTEVIAGTTALSAGIVTLALGAVLLRLSSIQRVLEHSQLGTAGDEPLDAGVAEDENTAAVESRSIEPTPANVGSDLPSSPPTEDTDQTGTSMVQAEDAHADRSSWRAKLRARLPGRRERSPIALASGDETGLELRPTSDPHPTDLDVGPGLDAPSYGSETSGSPEAESKWASHEASGRDSSGHRTASSGAAQESGSVPSVASGEAASAPTVVGRYDSAGASYVLLSDGAIEVETEAGLHRFGSMEELKRHIESQELQGSDQER